jgi:hypothetical protein
VGDAADDIAAGRYLAVDSIERKLWVMQIESKSGVRTLLQTMSCFFELVDGSICAVDELYL